MRNLKRALSLALATVMTLGLMVVGTGAVGYDDVADTDNVEAIEVLQAVGIMTGDENGDFNPDNLVTRNEMAVVMSQLLNLNYNYYRGTNPFTDVPAWAAPYVAACAAEGVTSGIGNGLYGGDNNVTAAQAALMILKALGYFQYEADFDGDWQVATIRQASYIRLFDRIDASAEEALTRNQIAQLVLNALKASMVEFTGDVGITVNGVVIGHNSQYTARTSADAQYDAIVGNTTDIAPQGQYIIQLGEELYDGDLRLQYTTDDFGRPSRYWEYDGDEIGTYVRNELIREEYTEKVTGKDLYDLLGKATIEDYDFEMYIDGEYEKAVLDNAYFTEGNLIRTNTEGVGATGNGVLTQVFVDTSAKEITVAIINTYLAKATDDYDEKKDEVDLEVYKISDDGHAGQYVKTSDSTESFEKVTSEDFPIVADAQDGDFYLVTVAAGELQSVEDVEIVAETTINKFTNQKSVTAEGAEYKYASTAMYDVDVLDAYDEQNMKSTSYNIYLDPYGYLIGIDIVEEASKYLFLTGIDGNSSNLSNKTADANVIFLDGTMDTVKVDLGESETDNGAPLTPAALMNTWCVYSVDKNDVYTLTQVADDNATFVDGAGKTDKVGQGWTHGMDNDPADDVATIDKKHVSLDGIAAAGFNKVYGNDESVYITAVTSKINANRIHTATAGNGDAVIISDVDSVAVGVQDVSLTAWNGNKVIASDINYTGVNDENAAQGVYTLFKNNGYVIGAVVVGEDNGATTNYAYVVSETGKSGLNMEAYDDSTEEYTWTRDVVVNGEVVELTEIDDGNPAIADMEQNHWYEVKYYADGTVRSVSDLCDPNGDGNTADTLFDANAGKFVGNIEYVEDSYDAGYDTIVLFEDLMGRPYVISSKGNTLQVETDTTSSKGFAVAASAKIVLVQDKVIKSDLSDVDYMADIETYDNGVKGLEKAIKDLNNNSKFQGYISAVFEDGLATSVVIYDRTATIVDDGETSNTTGMKMIDDAADNYYIGARIYTDEVWTPAKALNTLASAIRADGFSVTDVNATGTGGTLTWVDEDGARRTVNYTDIDRVYLIKLEVETSKKSVVAVSPSEFYLAANEGGKTITLTKTDNNGWGSGRAITFGGLSVDTGVVDPTNGLVMTFEMPAWNYNQDVTYTITIGA